jgi:hypothetical protein
VPKEIEATYVAEDHLDGGRRNGEEAFAAFFGRLISNLAEPGEATGSR